ncbi:phage exclusion protein Lit family protein [Flavobacterium plurextorum]|uniref:phage exclusion protein Lit family protein n=1 Tax=Flavobacterium TaxID=237 RepID=UPI00351A6CCC
MKKSVWQNSHSGKQPIRVLKHNLTTRLVNRNKEYIESLQSSSILDEKVKYHDQNLPLNNRQGPFIYENGLINIHETFLSYIWINCYYFVVLHEEKYALPNLIDKGEMEDRPESAELLSDAEDLFSYGLTLIKGFVDWDKETLPNPEYFDEESPQGNYILRVNDLFVEVLNFILYHETAHAEFQHIKKIKEGKLSNEEIKDLEIEADSRAIQLIIKNSTSRQKAEIAIAMGLASMLFIKNSLKGGSTHPDLDKRIENAIEILQPSEDSEIWTTLCLFIKTWDKQYGLGLVENSTCSTIKDVFYDLLQQAKSF